METNHGKRPVLRIDDFPEELRRDTERVIAWLNENGVDVSIAEGAFREAGTCDDMDEDSSQRVNDMLAELDYDYSMYSMQDYIAHVENFLGRKMRVVGMELSRATTGYCLRQPHRNVVFYNNTRHPMLQEHVIIHETAHLLLDHELMVVDVSDGKTTTDDIFNNIAMRFRSTLPVISIRDPLLYQLNMRQEGEAETFAKRFLARAKAYRKQQYLTEQRNARLFPPFGSAKSR
ncbi:MAG: ImmA/IrrE family metallo-endopeptidase [Chloroflexota bacterium]